jgi:hypothetical protein
MENADRGHPDCRGGESLQALAREAPQVSGSSPLLPVKVCRRHVLKDIDSGLKLRRRDQRCKPIGLRPPN